VTETHREGKREVHPFISYEVAKGIVEEMRVVSERRYRWRRTENEVVPSPPSWDDGVTDLLARDSAGEQEKVDA
jgi:hypothetical protein